MYLCVYSNSSLEQALNSQAAAEVAALIAAYLAERPAVAAPAAPGRGGAGCAGIFRQHVAKCYQTIGQEFDPFSAASAVHRIL